VVIGGESNPNGFRITRHEVTLYGLCPACSSSGSGAA
jgi:Fe2+ or Zn2+ uptake regulation protein